jgi:hypothetical protein
MYTTSSSLSKGKKDQTLYTNDENLLFLMKYLSYIYYEKTKIDDEYLYSKYFTVKNTKEDDEKRQK